jgi:hypothetical protein
MGCGWLLGVAMLCASCGGIATAETSAGTGGSNVPGPGVGTGGSNVAGPGVGLLDAAPSIEASVAPPDVESAPPCPTNAWYDTPGHLASNPLRSCATDADCVLRDQPSCCGVHIVVGMAHAAKCSSDSMTVCDQVRCANVAPTYMTDDGRQTNGMAGILVRCESGLCRTLGPNCGGQSCPDGYVCVQGDGAGSCKIIPPNCVAGSDLDCAGLLCVNGLSSWTSPGDVVCTYPI